MIRSIFIVSTYCLLELLPANVVDTSLSITLLWRVRSTLVISFTINSGYTGSMSKLYIYVRDSITEKTQMRRIGLISSINSTARILKHRSRRSSKRPPTPVRLSESHVIVQNDSLWSSITQHPTWVLLSGVLFEGPHRPINQNIFSP